MDNKVIQAGVFCTFCNNLAYQWFSVYRKGLGDLLPACFDCFNKRYPWCIKNWKTQAENNDR